MRDRSCETSWFITFVTLITFGLFLLWLACGPKPGPPSPEIITQILEVEVPGPTQLRWIPGEFEVPVGSTVILFVKSKPVTSVTIKTPNSVLTVLKSGIVTLGSKDSDMEFVYDDVEYLRYIAPEPPEPEIVEVEKIVEVEVEVPVIVEKEVIVEVEKIVEVPVEVVVEKEVIVEKIVEKIVEVEKEVVLPPTPVRFQVAPGSCICIKGYDCSKKALYFCEGGYVEFDYATGFYAGEPVMRVTWSCNEKTHTFFLNDLKYVGFHKKPLD